MNSGLCPVGGALPDISASESEDGDDDKHPAAAPGGDPAGTWADGATAKEEKPGSSGSGSAKCNYCSRAVAEKPPEAEWVQHWAYVLHSTQKLASDIERLDEEMNKLTARKRMFQKLFTRQFNKTPPENAGASTFPQWRGYIADLVRMEMELEARREDGEGRCPSALQPATNADSPARDHPTGKGKWALKGIFSMSARLRPAPMANDPPSLSPAAPPLPNGASPGWATPRKSTSKRQVQ